MNYKPASDYILSAADNLVIMAVRLMLAFTALLSIYIDPLEPPQLVRAASVLLVLYFLYSIGLYLLVWRRISTKPADFLVRWSQWIDIVWFTILIGLTGGSNSVFFFFFFFSILVASFRFGFRSGLAVTLVSFLLFTTFGYYAAPSGAAFELNRFLLRTVYLMVFGGLTVYWGGREILGKRRLALLRDVNRLSNPRFGIDQTVNLMMERIRSFYDADVCLWLSAESAASSGDWREVNRGDADLSRTAEQTPAAMPLLRIPGEFAVLYKRKFPFWWRMSCLVYNADTGERKAGDLVNGQALADLLDAQCFITIPMPPRSEIISRVYLTAQKQIFSASDVKFLTQLFENVLPLIENIRLLDDLASDAAQRQRQVISYDIHDSAVQPYIGLKLGLEALQLKQSSGQSINSDIENLIRQANDAINDLRQFIKKLKDGTDGEHEGGVLITAIKQQALKYQQLYHIHTEVRAKDGFRLNDRLAAEVFQIVLEGLSNIKRHTAARKAVIALRLENEKLVLEIENENENRAADFIPRSISERTAAMGGTVRVENSDKRTKISVDIPL